MQRMDNSGLLDAILRSAEDYAIVAISREGRIASWNEGARKVFGYTEDQVLGQSVDLLFTASDRAQGIPHQELAAARRKGRALDVRWHQRRDGTLFWADGVMTPMFDKDGELAGYVKVLRDATEKREQELEIARLARIDPLTGLANRAEFDERFTGMTAAAARHKQLLILQLVDLDHFKQVNDRFGHQVGDQVLQQAAERMRHCVRETDFVARLGGDEFIVLQPDAASAAVGGTVAEKLIEMLSHPYQVDGLEVRIGCSIGISVYPQDASDPDQMLRKADLALYKVKGETRSGYHYFSDELDQLAHKRRRELAGLRRAVASKNFSLHYQPKIGTATGRVVAVEALLRCHERALDGYPVGDVIHLAKEAGLMEELGLWAIGEACAQMRRWHDTGLTDLTLCVNICADEMKDPHFPALINGMLARHGLAPEHLDVEITEREMFDSGDQGLATLASLRERHIAVAIDDFGTGYSSLSYLSELPVDQIKLDRSFLRHIPESEHDRTVARAIIHLAHALDLEVVVEGVETLDQSEFFQREHCEMMQGYFFSPPLAADEMTRWLGERRDQNLLPTAQGSAHGADLQPRH